MTGAIRSSDALARALMDEHLDITRFYRKRSGRCIRIEPIEIDGPTDSGLQLPPPLVAVCQPYRESLLAVGNRL